MAANRFSCFGFTCSLVLFVITDKEIQAYWKFYWILMFKWFGRSFLAFISTAVIWDFISKNYLGSKKWYSSMNDTSDGDFGSEKWRKETGRSKGLWSAFLWWWINHSWNYIRQFIPEFEGGEVDKDSNGNDIFIAIKDTLNKKTDYGRWTRAIGKDGIFGTNYIAFKINGNTYCQYSFANKYFTIQLGGGSEYRFRMKFHPFNKK